jgi:V/A-type H+-transporting ATPase subunit K
MMIAIKITLVLALVLGIILPCAYFFAGAREKGRYKRALAGNVVFFFGCLIVSAVMMYNAAPALAETETAAAAAANSSAGWAYIAAALSTGLSCLGGGIAVASAASAALGAISEDSSVLGKSLIFVGLAEGVCLYGLIISFMILGKV